MKVLVATPEGQGTESGDFYFLEDGEYVYIGFVCDSDRRNPLGGCGCGRAFSGAKTHKGGTTAKVIDQPGLTWDQYEQIIRDSLTDAGWVSDDDDGVLVETMENLRGILQASRTGDLLRHIHPNVLVVGRSL